MVVFYKKLLSSTYCFHEEWVNMLGKNLPTVVQDHLCVTRLQLGLSVFRSAVSYAFGLSCKCPVSLHPLQALASPNPTKAPWGGPFL